MADFEKLMRSAFRLAEKGLGYTSPNPPVGAFIFKNGHIIARGYHRRAGLPHAEIEALRKAGGEAVGATLITTLEPCSHHGKTPPCADAIISAGIKTVVGAITDKNPLVSGKGYRRLRAAGIEVVDGVLKERAVTFYEPYIKFITTGLPYVTLKYAQSLDGRIATRTGHSRWISSPKSLKLSHKLRAISDGIIIGSRTLASDDSKLTTRLVKGSNPIRIILSNSGRISGDRNVFKDGEAPTYVATSRGSHLKGMSGVERILVRKHRKGLNLKDLLVKLGRMGIVTLLVEGGSGVLTSFLRQKLVDRIIVCVAPILIGDGIPAFGGLGVEMVDESVGLEDVEWKRSGPDMIVSARPLWR
jgi:diaminohydroxyphosphoribosylaminopyrimidine deaminase/5-amino-6-(5-phosphoribosylamino)uracil reductase